MSGTNYERKVDFMSGGENELIISREMIEGKEKRERGEERRRQKAEKKEENEHTHKDRNMYMVMFSGKKSTYLN